MLNTLSFSFNRLSEKKMEISLKKQLNLKKKKKLNNSQLLLNSSKKKINYLSPLSSKNQYSLMSEKETSYNKQLNDNEQSYINNINMILEKPILDFRKKKIHRNGSDSKIKYVKKNLLILEERLDRKNLINKNVNKKHIDKILLPEIKNKSQINSESLIENSNNDIYDDDFAIVLYPKKTTNIKNKLTRYINLKKCDDNINNNIIIDKYKNLMKIPNDRIFIPHSNSTKNIKYKNENFNSYSNDLIFQLKSRRLSDLKFLDRIQEANKKKKNKSLFSEYIKKNNEQLRKMKNKSYHSFMNKINNNSIEMLKINEEINSKLDVNQFDIFKNEEKYIKF